MLLVISMTSQMNVLNNKQLLIFCAFEFMGESAGCQNQLIVDYVLFNSKLCVNSRF